MSWGWPPFVVSCVGNRTWCTSKSKKCAAAWQWSAQEQFTHDAMKGSCTCGWFVVFLTQLHSSMALLIRCIPEVHVLASHVAKLMRRRSDLRGPHYLEAMHYLPVCVVLFQMGASRAYHHIAHACVIDVVTSTGRMKGETRHR